MYVHCTVCPLAVSPFAKVWVQAQSTRTGCSYLTKEANSCFMSRNFTSTSADFSGVPNLKRLYVDNNPELQCVPASLGSLEAIGVQGCDVSFQEKVRRSPFVGQEVSLLPIGQCSGLGPAPLLELAARATHLYLKSMSWIICIAYVYFSPPLPSLPLSPSSMQWLSSWIWPLFLLRRNRRLYYQELTET